MAFSASTKNTTQMAKSETEAKKTLGASIDDLTKVAAMDKAWTKKPCNLVFANKQQIKLKLQKKQNALFVFLKKPKAEPETPVHRIYMAASPPELKAVTEIYEGELRYCHESRPGEVLSLPMEVMLDPFNINWCVVDAKQSSEAPTLTLNQGSEATTSTLNQSSEATTLVQPMPDMERELVVLYTHNIRSETLASKTKTPQGDEITTYHTTLNKADGTTEKTVSISIKTAASLPN